jgi:hypothetical protein
MRPILLLLVYSQDIVFSITDVFHGFEECYQNPNFGIMLKIADGFRDDSINIGKTVKCARTEPSLKFKG